MNGGKVIGCGSVQDIINAKGSITGKYLSGEKYIPIPEKVREGNGNFLHVKNAHINNLKNIDVDIPLGKIVCLTGVSGSGKSSFLVDLIYEYAIHTLRGNKATPQGGDDITGFVFKNQ